MRQTLWTDDDTLEAGVEAHFATPKPDVIVFVAENAGKLIGFAEVGKSTPKKRLARAALFATPDVREAFALRKT